MLPLSSAMYTMPPATAALPSTESGVWNCHDDASVGCAVGVAAFVAGALGGALVRAGGVADRMGVGCLTSQKASTPATAAAAITSTETATAAWRRSRCR